MRAFLRKASAARTLFLVATALPCFGQPVEFGVKGGIPLTEAFETGSFFLIEFGEGATSATRRYTIGPTVETRLPHGFGVEFDVLYKRLGFDDLTKDLGVNLFPPADFRKFLGISSAGDLSASALAAIESLPRERSIVPRSERRFRYDDYDLFQWLLNDQLDQLDRWPPERPLSLWRGRWSGSQSPLRASPRVTGGAVHPMEAGSHVGSRALLQSESG